MPDNELKPCPFCGSTNIVDDGIGSLRCNAFPCGVETSKADWNNRPGEDAARLKQFEEDCKVMCQYCREGRSIEQHPLGKLEWQHRYAQGEIQTQFCTATPLRRAWEERHVV